MRSSSEVTEIFEVLKSSNPNPKTELVYVNEYTLLVAVVLSAQATDISVNKATKDLFKIAATPKEMVELGEEGLKLYIKSIGLYNSKAKNVIALSKILLHQYNGEIPKNLDELKELPGVGRKTVNVILNVAFNEPTIAVDTHVFRVAKRLHLSNANTPLSVEKDLLEVVPTKFLGLAHHLLILHGRYICKAKKPLCNLCKINRLCFSEDKIL